VVGLTARKDSSGTHRYAEIMVDYDGARLPHMMAISEQKEFLHRQAGGEFVRVIRMADAELALINDLTGSNLPEWVNTLHVNGTIQLSVEAKTSRDMVLWQDLIDGKLADLRRDGWIIERSLQRMKSFSGIESVPIPTKLTADLRDYQRDGLNWLQFLREFGFSGILADDMGLGKTVQALATVLLEKEQGRATTPSLVVAPTSLMGNWRKEAEKFAPELRVLVLHGTERTSYFDQLDEYDLLLTTYALLSRDLEIHQQRKYHYLILDEAQAIKNPATKQAKAVCEVKANHKFCLTGTPVENHLGEVWSQFRFLMPGFFGDQKGFNKTFRNPIEKTSETLPAIALTKRLKPFILRRSKDAVASELPSKTEIVHRVSMYPEQAVLYEGIRASMESRVRRALAESGLKQHQLKLKKGQILSPAGTTWYRS